MVTALRYHDWVQDNNFRCIMSQLLGDDFNGLNLGNHSYFYSVNLNIVKDCLDLLSDHATRYILYGKYSLSILSGDRCNHTHSVNSVSRKRFYIGLYACSSTTV